MGREVVVTVVGTRRAGHLALDEDVVVGRISAELALRYGSPGEGGLVLVKEDGTVLQPWMSLQQGGVSQGDRLVLRTVAAAMAPPPARRRSLRLRLWPA